MKRESRYKNDRKRVPAPLPDDTLRTRMREGRVIPFVGAGISMGARTGRRRRFPGTRELVLQLAGRCGVEVNTERFQGTLDEGAFESAAIIREKVRNDDRYYRALRDVLVPLSLSAKPSPVHEVLDILQFPCIITTNYDRLLETFIYPHPEVFTWHDEVSMTLNTEVKNPFIFKLNGDITRPETIVLGTSKSALKSNLFLKHLMLDYSLLFLGCSFADSILVDFLRRFRKAFDSIGGPHYALINHGALSQDQRQSLDGELGIKFVPFEADSSYSQVWEFLAHLMPRRRGPQKGTKGWKAFYLPYERAAYRNQQLSFERISREVWYSTPLLSNRFGTDEYLERSARWWVDSRGAEQIETVSQVFDHMREIRNNLRDRILSGEVDVRHLFLESSLDADFSKPDAIISGRYRYLLDLIDTHRLSVRILQGRLDKDLFRKMSYALMFMPSNRLRGRCDIALAYASQVGSHDFRPNMIHVNTRQVDEAVARFARLWNCALDEEKSRGLIVRELRQPKKRAGQTTSSRLTD